MAALSTLAGAGERADVFASANMEHPQALAALGRAGTVSRFARNALCALVSPRVHVTPLGRDGQAILARHGFSPP